MTQTDELVAAYLARVERAANRLPAGRREELIADLREHIEIARAESEAVTEAEVRMILERLGDPESIVAAADTQTDLPRVPAAAPYPPAGPYQHPAQPAPATRNSRTALWVALAMAALFTLVLLCSGAFFLLAGNEPAPSPAVTEELVPAEPAAPPTMTVSPGP